VFQRVVAGVLLVVGATMGLGVVAVTGRHDAAAIAGAFVFTSLAPIGAGLWLWRRARLQTRARLEANDDREQARLLRLAQDRGGHLTVVEVVAGAGLSAARAEQLLERMVRQTLAEHRVADDGTMVYRVKRLLGEAEKQRAEGVLERR
jgi:hypothetical protein